MHNVISDIKLLMFLSPTLCDTPKLSNVNTRQRNSLFTYIKSVIYGLYFIRKVFSLEISNCSSAFEHTKRM